MANLPVSMDSMFVSSSSLSQLPEEITKTFAASYEDAFAGMGGAGQRRIRIRKTDFELLDGGSSTAIPANELAGVFVGAAKSNYAVWYERDYAPGQEPEAPDLIWEIDSACTVFPDALPEEYRHKVMRGGKLRWGFQIRKRLAFVLLRNFNGTNVLDCDHPYILDVTAMSLYGNGLPQQNMFKWAGLRDLCQQYSVGNIQVTPSMFLTQIVLDPTVSVSGVVMFRPYFDRNNHLAFLNPDIMSQVYETACSEGTRELLTVREKLTYGDDNENAVPVQEHKPAPKPAAPVQAPKPAAPVQEPKPAPVQKEVKAEVPHAEPVKDAAMRSLLDQAEAAMSQGKTATVSHNTAKAAPAPDEGPVANNVQALLDELSF